MALTLLEPIIVNTAANFTFANASVTSNITAGNVKTDNLLYANGSPYVFTTSAAGSNTQVQFNDANAFAGSANFTFNKTSNTLSVTNITANGAGLTALNGSNITGQVTNALVAGTVYTAAQPNITSIGTLTGLGVNATVTAVGFTANTGIFTGNGSGLTNITGANVTGTVPNATHSSTANTVTNAGQPNITSVGLLTALSVGPNSSITLTGTSGYIKANSIQGTDGVNALYPGYSGVTGAVGVTGNLTVGIGIAANITANGNVTANYFIGNGSSLSSLTGGNVTGQVSNALVTGTVYTNAQPNITSVGTLTGLTSNGVVNFINSSNVSLGAIGNVKVTGGTNGQYLITDGAGNLSFTTLNVSTSSISNGNSNVNIPAANGNINMSAAGNANILVVTGTGINVAGTFNATGNANVGNIGATGVVAITLGGSLTTAAQPNITSVGTLTELTSNGTVNFINASNVSLGAVGNIKITGGTSGQYLSTDGTGNLSWGTVAAGGGSSISNGTSNVNIPAANGNVTVSVNSVSNVVVFDENGFTVSGGTGNITGANYVIANYFSGNGSILSSLTGANVTGQVANALVAGTVYTAAQPNITSVGTLTSLNVSGVSTFYTAQDRFSALTGATGIVTHNMSNGAVFYHTSPAANFTPNFTNVPTTNNYITVAVIFIQQGATAYMPTATTNVQIDGSNVAVKWINSLVPTGAANTVNMVSYSLIRNSGAWSVLGQGAAFA